MSDLILNEQVKSKIVSVLSQGAFISGQVLANRFAISRSAVCIHVKELKGMGLDIYSVKGKGYKLAQPLTLLQQSKIIELLDPRQLTSDRSILIQSIVGSTNDEIRKLMPSIGNGSVYLAEAQTSGRGRRGRKWVSPFGSSIYMSMVWRFESGYESIAGLSLLVGMAVRRAIIGIGCPEVQLKWPNDVYVDNKKIAGILIEVEGQVGGLIEVIIGIGINVRLPDIQLGIDQAHTDIHRVLNADIDRNQLVAALLKQLWMMLEEFESTGLQTFLPEWSQADLFSDKPVRLQAGSSIVEGICKGVNQSGALMVQVGTTLKAFHGGEISVRSNSSA